MTYRGAVTLPSATVLDPGLRRDDVKVEKGDWLRWLMEDRIWSF